MPTPTTLPDQTLQKLLALDKKRLETTELPIVTVSATFKEDLKSWYGLEADNKTPDVVFSRAHYSMAIGVAVEAWENRIHPSKAWLVDPTNYVTMNDLKQVQLTETIGKLLARNPLLKSVKDIVDKFGRNKLPILKSITPSLLYLTQDIQGPILSLHIAAGNILAEAGKTVVQVITDPHVRSDYLNNADKPHMYFCVFDERTKAEFLEKAALASKLVNPNRVIVTGPPVDPRVVAARFHKKAHSNGPLKLCITTGGLGTNKQEIETVLEQLLPSLTQKPSAYQVMVYAGTQKDFYTSVKELAKKYKVRIGKISDKDASLRLIYHPQIVDANELLIKHGFPWADGFITKPSGDMAYDAVAAGCFVLTLAEWGEWEFNIREVFEQQNISRVAQIDAIVTQLQSILQPFEQNQSWVERAMCNALSIEGLFLDGAKNIANSFQKIKKEQSK